MDATPRHGLPYVIAAQAQKHVIVNEAFRALDALVQASAQSATVLAQPSDPPAGDGYVLPEGASGPAWSGLPAGSLVVFQDGAWTRFPPTIGMTVWIEDEGVHRAWDGAAWIAASEPSTPQTSAPRFGVNAEADDTNRLVVASDAVLHTHDGGDTRHVLNKQAPGDTASLVFQTGYSGRAEIGLTGSDDLAVKVSADGVVFREAIAIDRATGEVRFPNTDLAAGGLTAGGLRSGGLASEGLASESLASRDPASGGGGGISPMDAASTAEASSQGLHARLLADGGVAGGNLALTRQVVLATTSGKVQLASAADGNLVEVFSDGAALAAGSVSRRLFMGRGEVAVLDGLSAGAVLASTRGVCGASASTDEGPMPLGIEGFSGRRFSLYALREGGDGGGRVVVSAGAVPATARLLSGDGARVVDEASLCAYGLAVLRADTDAEFQLVADQPVLVGTLAGTSEAGSPCRDQRLLPPPSNELIGYGGSGYVSALYPDTVVRWHRRDGTAGGFSVSPGAPVALQDAMGAGEAGYGPDACLILRASGPISAFSGAGRAGRGGAPFFPLSSLGQAVPLPLGSWAGSGAMGSLAVASPYEGTARLFAPDGRLLATLALTRGGTLSGPGDQDAPCAGDAAMPGEFAGGLVEADVPIYVVQSSDGNQEVVAGGVGTIGGETAWPGVTPEDIRATIRRDEAGFLRRRRIDGDGMEAWVPC